MKPASTSIKGSPIRWVPTLYFAEGLPYFVVATIAGLMFKSMGLSNSEIARWTGLLGFVWVFKPLWSPFLEMARSQKKLILLFQLGGGLAMGLMALALQLPAWFAISLVLLLIVSIASATHDIAADGLYIASLSSKQQAEYAGWQGGFYNVARFFSLGGMLFLAGYFEQRMDVAHAWSIIFAMLGGIMVLLSLYHAKTLPEVVKAPDALTQDHSARGVYLTMREVIIEFFKKPNIWMALVFIILFRAAEGQVTTIGPLFLRATRAEGGLGLTTAEVAQIYGTLATLAFVGGSVLGGYFTSWLGLRRAMFFLILAMNFPNIAYFFLSTVMPTDLRIITAALTFEMFGYGFGFVGLILFIMQEVAVGKFQTAHYALGTGFMQLGYVIFKMVSGDIQAALGYQHFFVWVLISALPVLILSKVIRFRSDDERKPAVEEAVPTVQT